MIIGSDMPPEDVARLERIAPVLVFDAWSGDHDNVAAARYIFLEIAELTGRVERAGALLEEMGVELQDLSTSIAEAFGGTPPETAVIRLNDDASVWIYGDNSLPVAALEELGIDNALPQPVSRWGVAQKQVDALAAVENGALIAIRPHMAGEAVFETALWKFLPVVQNDMFAELRPVWSYGGYLSVLRHARAFHDALMPLAE